jgi:hypothetical protein
MSEKPQSLLQQMRKNLSMELPDRLQASAESSPENHDEATVTQLDHGTIDYRPIVKQPARTQHIQHAFAEQEAFNKPHGRNR